MIGSDVFRCPIGLDEGGIGRKAVSFSKAKKARGFSVDLPLSRSILTSSELPKTLGEGGFSSQFLNILLDNMRLADGTGGGSFAVHLLDVSSFKPWMIASLGLV